VAAAAIPVIIVLRGVATEEIREEVMTIEVIIQETLLADVLTACWLEQLQEHSAVYPELLSER